jgi:outer membrane lipoprotein SlyB
MKTFTLILFLVLTVFIALACESRTSSNVYSRQQAQRVFTVDEGLVVYVRQVQIEGSVTGLGAIAGGVMGYVVGGTIGEGSGQDVARAAGTITGAAAGAALEEHASHRDGLEITVQLDNGQVMAIVQAADQAFDVGDRVRILRRPDGSARVVQ